MRKSKNYVQERVSFISETGAFPEELAYLKVATRPWSGFLQTS